MNGMIREQIGLATLYCGDCADLLFELPHVCAVVTDPPYGIGVAKNKYKGTAAPVVDYGDLDWDDEKISDDLMANVIQAGDKAIVFGGNYYSLPPTSCYLVWDKVNGKIGFADCELAWTNLPKATRLIRFMWHGMLRDGKEDRGDHPTQKPVHVMKWAIDKLDAPKTILDPFMGSGTTGVACVEMGIQFIGVERHQPYFDAACRRIEKAQQQLKLDI